MGGCQRAGWRLLLPTPCVEGVPHYTEKWDYRQRTYSPWGVGLPRALHYTRKLLCQRWVGRWRSTYARVRLLRCRTALLHSWVHADGAGVCEWGVECVFGDMVHMCGVTRGTSKETRVTLLVPRGHTLWVTLHTGPHFVLVSLCELQSVTFWVVLGFDLVHTLTHTPSTWGLVSQGLLKI